jgi:hypothetical protein
LDARATVALVTVAEVTRKVEMTCSNSNAKIQHVALVRLQVKFLFRYDHDSFVKALSRRALARIIHKWFSHPLLRKSLG